MDRPLLEGGYAADPPIDDEDYNYEDQKFPTGTQIHFIYAIYLLSSSVSRVWEATCPIIIALCYKKDLAMVSIYSAFFALLAPQLEQYGRRKVARSPRFTLMRNVILQHRLLPFLATILLSLDSTWKVHGWMRHILMVVTIVCIVAARAGTVTQLLAIEKDWTHIMSNEQSGVCDSISKNLQLIGFSVSMIAPIVAGILVYHLWIQKALNVLRFALGLSLVVEFTLIYQLYSTCYALRVPRPHQPDFNANLVSILPDMTIRKILQYVWIKPRPVVCSLGIILLKASFIAIGPQFIFYFLNIEKMPIWVVGFLPSIQLATYIFPSLFSSGAAIAVNLVALVSVIVLVKWDTSYSGYLIAASIIISRSCLQALDQTGQWYIEDLVNDKSVLNLFHKAELHTLRVVDVFSQCLTLIWYRPENFEIPVMISGALAILGVGMFTVCRLSSATWHV